MTVIVVTAEGERGKGPGAVLLKELSVIGIDGYRKGLVFDTAAKNMNARRFHKREERVDAVIGSAKPLRSFA